MSIYTGIWKVLILCKNVKVSDFSDVIEIANICFWLERKSFSDSQSFEVFGDILID